MKTINHLSDLTNNHQTFLTRKSNQPRNRQEDFSNNGHLKKTVQKTSGHFAIIVYHIQGYKKTKSLPK